MCIPTTLETFPASPPAWFQILVHRTFILSSNSPNVPLVSPLCAGDSAVGSCSPPGVLQHPSPGASACTGQRMETGPGGCTGGWEPAEASQGEGCRSPHGSHAHSVSAQEGVNGPECPLVPPGEAPGPQAGLGAKLGSLAPARPDDRCLRWRRTCCSPCFQPGCLRPGDALRGGG